VGEEGKRVVVFTSLATFMSKCHRQSELGTLTYIRRLITPTWLLATVNPFESAVTSVITVRTPVRKAEAGLLTRAAQ
jgi:hypothetical protein